MFLNDSQELRLLNVCVTREEMNERKYYKSESEMYITLTEINIEFV